MLKKVSFRVVYPMIQEAGEAGIDIFTLARMIYGEVNYDTKNAVSGHAHRMRKLGLIRGTFMSDGRIWATTPAAPLFDKSKVDFSKPPTPPTLIPRASSMGASTSDVMKLLRDVADASSMLSDLVDELMTAYEHDEKSLVAARKVHAALKDL